MVEQAIAQMIKEDPAAIQAKDCSCAYGLRPTKFHSSINQSNTRVGQAVFIKNKEAVKPKAHNKSDTMKAAGRSLVKASLVK